MLSLLFASNELNSYSGYAATRGRCKITSPIFWISVIVLISRRDRKIKEIKASCADTIFFGTTQLRQNANRWKSAHII